jgi:4a-hydroxytetrahydrobiopterin dehydratase
MAVQTSKELAHKQCSPDGEDIATVKRPAAEAQLKKLPGWRISHAGKRIRKDWTVKNFAAGLDFFERVGRLAEADKHHPDLHLEEYRNVWIELWTHKIGGLSDNDFILAAKINDLSVELKPAK